MTKKVSTLALMAVLSSSLVFAGEKKKPNSANDSPATTERSTQNSDTPDGRQMKHKKDQQQARPSQEEEFNRVLQGIYG